MDVLRDPDGEITGYIVSTKKGSMTIRPPKIYPNSLPHALGERQVSKRGDVWYRQGKPLASIVKVEPNKWRELKRLSGLKGKAWIKYRRELGRRLADQTAIV